MRVRITPPPPYQHWNTHRPRVGALGLNTTFSEVQMFGRQRRLGENTQANEGFLVLSRTDSPLNATVWKLNGSETGLGIIKGNN